MTSCCELGLSKGGEERSGTVLLVGGGARGIEREGGREEEGKAEEAACVCAGRQRR